MPNSPRADNPHRMVRVEDALWSAAKARAAEEGTTVSAVIRAGLRAFVAGEVPAPPGSRMADAYGDDPSW